MTRTTRKLLHLLASMEFAIMLFIVIAIASIIGTLLQQNQPYNAYLIQFGPFWHEIYLNLGLYALYSSLWFLLLLAFLVLSTSLCVYRHTPRILRSMRIFNISIKTEALERLPVFKSWHTNHVDLTELGAFFEQVLRSSGARYKVCKTADYMTLAAIYGLTNRFGYLATHIGVIVICIGAGIDGNVSLKIKRMFGAVQVESRDIPVFDVPVASRLPKDNQSFRATVGIPEGGMTNVAFINIADGYLVQELPFWVRLDDFRIEYYPTGQPKSFLSDLSILDGEDTIQKTISVNQPLFYKGYNFYQTSFDDGGSQVELVFHSLRGVVLDKGALVGHVGEHYPLVVNGNPVQLELTDFKLSNVFPITNEQGRDFKDYGESITFRLRDNTGTAREYIHYLSPVLLEDDYFFISGVREDINEEFSYLHIPVDGEHSIALFLKFHDALYDEQKLNSVIQRIADTILPDMEDMTRYNVARAALDELLLSFRIQGFDDISAHISNSIPLAEQEKAVHTYAGVLKMIVYALFEEVLAEQAVNFDEAQRLQFFDAAFIALSYLHHYGAPFWLELTEYQQRQLSGLQITRSPGAKWVYLGCLLLVVGIFLMFYVPYRKIWIRLLPEGTGTHILLAGIQKRKGKDRTFNSMFLDLSEQLKAVS